MIGPNTKGHSEYFHQYIGIYIYMYYVSAQPHDEIQKTS